MAKMYRGLRVRLTRGQVQCLPRGTDPADVPDSLRSPHIDWVAGRVPVGSIGTLIQQIPSSYVVGDKTKWIAIQWDNIKPKQSPGGQKYEFGLNGEWGDDLPYTFEQELSFNGIPAFFVVRSDGKFLRTWDFTPFREGVGVLPPPECSFVEQNNATVLYVANEAFDLVKVIKENYTWGKDYTYHIVHLQ